MTIMERADVSGELNGDVRNANIAAAIIKRGNHNCILNLFFSTIILDLCFSF
jgi:hypothetical protein